MNTLPAASFSDVRPRKWMIHLISAGLLGPFVFLNAAVDVSKLPPPSGEPVDYVRDILPIFESKCFRCHGPERPKSKFRLDDRESALRGGSHGTALTPGDSANSPLVHFVAGLDDDMLMPPEGKGDRLTTREIAMLRTWIDQGAQYSGATAGIQFTVEPGVQWVHVDGNLAKFREHAWLDEGWDGGLQSLAIHDRFKDGIKLDVDAEARIGSPRYKFRFSLEKEELGFVRGGFEQFRKYYSDLGGVYEAAGIPPLQLGEGLSLDTGRAWFEAGLTLPDLPRIVFGYEYRYRDGTKSALNWGMAGGRGGTAMVYPGFKMVDEQTHIVKLDVSYDLNGLLIEDNFRAEFFDLRNQKTTADFYQLGAKDPASFSRFRDEYDHVQGVNTFRLEKWIRDGWMVTGGYYFSRLEGDAGFSQDTFIPNDPTQPAFLGISSRQIVLDQTSHVFNANTQLGPWKDLTFSAGVQSEWTRQHGIGTAIDANGSPVAYGGNLDRTVTEERFGLRYTAVPSTVVFAEARFQQERIGSLENQQLDDGVDSESDFMRDTLARDDLKEYRGGFIVSPWTRVSFQSGYRIRLKQNDYDFRGDSDSGITPGNGYPSFIQSRDIRSHDWESKLVLHWFAWLKTTLKYQLLSSDYRTITAQVLDPSTGNPAPSGGLLAGNYDAHVYSLLTTFSPWRRLHLSSTVAYTESRIRSDITDSAQLPAYLGNTWSLLESATFAATEKADLTISYSYSRADYGQQNTLGVLPMGVEYERHGLLAGIRQKVSKHVTAKLQYGFFRYREPAFQGMNDYTAHAVFASMAFTLP